MAFKLCMTVDMIHCGLHTHVFVLKTLTVTLTTFDSLVLLVICYLCLLIVILIGFFMQLYEGGNPTTVGNGSYKA